MLFDRWRAPIYRLLIPFAAGILLRDRHAMPTIPLLACISLLGIMIFLLHRAPLRWRWKVEALGGLLIWGVLIALGILYRSARELRDRPDWIGHLPTTERPYLLTFREEPKKLVPGGSYKPMWPPIWIRIPNAMELAGSTSIPEMIPYGDRCIPAHPPGSLSDFVPSPTNPIPDSIMSPIADDKRSLIRPMCTDWIKSSRYRPTSQAWG